MQIMKKLKLILAGVLLFASSLVSAQETVFSMPRFRLGIEAGVMNAFYTETNKPAGLRENQAYYYDYDHGYLDDYLDDYYCGFIFRGQDYNLYYVGLKPEYSLNERFAVAAGLRFSFNTSELNSDRDYFLWKTSESGMNTNYVKVKNVSQRNLFIGLPLELKIFPRKRDYLVRHYFVFGTAMSVLINSRNEITFQNENMEKHNSLISGQLGKPNSFQGHAYFGFGLKIGRTSHPFGNIEVHLPVIIFNNDRLSSFTKAKDAAGIAIQTTLQIPLLKNHKIQYTVKNRLKNTQI
jgi:hypothetical protein